MMFDFLLNPRLWLALARCDAEPLIDALKTPVRLPSGGQWVTFLRNHDELDLSRLTDEQRSDVFRAFAPRADMRLYGRGIRRRLAPMLRDRRRIELAYALQFSLRGTPVIRYGEEIGMSENLKLPDREAIRTPMQWDSTRNAGFSDAEPQPFPVRSTRAARTGPRQVNVRAQNREPNSLLRWFENLIHTLRHRTRNRHRQLRDPSMCRCLARCSRIGATRASGSILLLHNLADRRSPWTSAASTA